MYNDEMYDMYQRKTVSKVGEIYLYVVEKGDNTWQIAKQLNSNVEWIRALNNLDANNTIYPQQQLLIPVMDKRPRPPYRDMPNPVATQMIDPMSNPMINPMNPAANQMMNPMGSPMENPMANQMPNQYDLYF